MGDDVSPLDVAGALYANYVECPVPRCRCVSKWLLAEEGGRCVPRCAKHGDAARGRHVAEFRCMWSADDVRASLRRVRLDRPSHEPAVHELLRQVVCGTRGSSPTYRAGAYKLKPRRRPPGGVYWAGKRPRR